MMEKSFEITKDLLEKLQKVELEMLIEVDRICRKNNIKYSIINELKIDNYIPIDSYIKFLKKIDSTNLEEMVCSFLWSWI